MLWHWYSNSLLVHRASWGRYPLHSTLLASPHFNLASSFLPFFLPSFLPSLFLTSSLHYYCTFPFHLLLICPHSIHPIPLYPTSSLFSTHRLQLAVSTSTGLGHADPLPLTAEETLHTTPRRTLLFSQEKGHLLQAVEHPHRTANAIQHQVWWERRDNFAISYRILCNDMLRVHCTG